ncbi:MAG: hypothetical protein GYB67_08980 [Chloroflexi bacterium]|nr:hypothetical protein [Chloroflexota bacterium]
MKSSIARQTISPGRTLLTGFMLLIVLIGVVGVAAAQDSGAPITNPALAAQMDDLVLITERVRGLDTLEPVERRFPTRAEVIAYISDLYATELPPEEWARLTRFYVALGLLGPDIDLAATFLDLLGSQVAGFYDTDTRLMNVVPVSGDGPGDGLSFSEQIIFIHEYTHALQDQHYDLAALLEASADLPLDQGMAQLALIEGDASAVMNIYSQRVIETNPLASLALIIEGLQAGNLFLPEGIPAALARELLFPYEEGLVFVVALLDAGDGWEQVEAAYADLPQTTEQILHPEKYLAGEGAVEVVGVTLSDQLGDAWVIDWDMPLGEFYLREHLRAQLDLLTARQAAAGWGGDRFQLAHNPATGAIVWTLALAWDTPADAVEFAAAYAAWGAARFGAAADADGCWSGAGAAICARADADGSLITAAPTRALAFDLLAAE